MAALTGNSSGLGDSLAAELRIQSTGLKSKWDPSKPFKNAVATRVHIKMLAREHNISHMTIPSYTRASLAAASGAVGGPADKTRSKTTNAELEAAEAAYDADDAKLFALMMRVVDMSAEWVARKIENEFEPGQQGHSFFLWFHTMTDTNKEGHQSRIEDDIKNYKFPGTNDAQAIYQSANGLWCLYQQQEEFRPSDYSKCIKRVLRSIPQDHAANQYATTMRLMQDSADKKGTEPYWSSFESFASHLRDDIAAYVPQQAYQDTQHTFPMQQRGSQGRGQNEPPLRPNNCKGQKGCFLGGCNAEGDAQKCLARCPQAKLQSLLTGVPHNDNANYLERIQFTRWWAEQNPGKPIPKNFERSDWQQYHKANAGKGTQSVFQAGTESEFEALYASLDEGFEGLVMQTAPPLLPSEPTTDPPSAEVQLPSPVHTSVIVAKPPASEEGGAWQTVQRRRARTEPAPDAVTTPRTSAPPCVPHHLACARAALSVLAQPEADRPSEAPSPPPPMQLTPPPDPPPASVSPLDNDADPKPTDERLTSILHVLTQMQGELANLTRQNAQLRDENAHLQDRFSILEAKLPLAPDATTDALHAKGALFLEEVSGALDDTAPPCIREPPHFGAAAELQTCLEDWDPPELLPLPTTPSRPPPTDPFDDWLDSHRSHRSLTAEPSPPESPPLSSPSKSLRHQASFGGGA